MPVIFKNPGVIDPAALTTFGVSVKEGESPIGFFGTGFKYAVAVILRNGCSIMVKSGHETYNFDLESKSIRGENFNIVTMNGTPLGFTTHVGVNWELWMAYRELWSNAIDEGGTVFQTNLAAEHSPNETTIIIRGRDFEEVYVNRGKYIIESKPMFETPYANIHPGETENIYYKNMLVYKSNKVCKHTYNIISAISLTEDRTAKYDWEVSGKIAKTVLSLEDKPTIEGVLTDQNYAEFDLNYTNEYITPTETFLSTIEALAKDRGRASNKSARKLVENRIRAELTVEGMQLTKLQKEILDRAEEFLIKMGYNIKVFPIIVTDNLGTGILGLAEDGRIYISSLAFDKGTKYVAGTLLEEYLHLERGFPDESRAMQNYLLDKLVSLAEEHIWKRPL